MQQNSLRLGLGDMLVLLLVSLFFRVEGDLFVFQKDSGTSGVLQAMKRTTSLQQCPGCVAAFPYVLTQFEKILDTGLGLVHSHTLIETICLEYLTPKGKKIFKKSNILGHLRLNDTPHIQLQ